MKTVCCFCEKVYSYNPVFCDNCAEYKGLMPIDEFVQVYGKLV